MNATKRESRNTRLGPADTNRIHQVVDRLVNADAPLSAIRSLIARGSSPLSDSFERYATLTLRDAGADELVALSARVAVHVEPPAEGRLARFIVKGCLSESEQKRLTDVEDALLALRYAIGIKKPTTNQWLYRQNNTGTFDDITDRFWKR